MPKVKVNQETVFQYDGVLLFPEWNEVTADELEKLKTAKLSIQVGILELEDSPSEKPKK
jgi:hypothetical protein